MAFELHSLRQTHTLTFLEVPVRAIAFMMNALANHDNNVRRVRIALTSADHNSVLAGGDRLLEIAEDCGPIDQVLSRKEFLDRGIKVEVANCFWRFMHRRDIPWSVETIDLSSCIFPRLARAKALVFVVNPHDYSKYPRGAPGGLPAAS